MLSLVGMLTVIQEQGLNVHWSICRHSDAKAQRFYFSANGTSLKRPASPGKPELSHFCTEVPLAHSGGDSRYHQKQDI